MKLPAISLGVRCLWKLCKCIPHLQQGTYSIKPNLATAFFQESESKVWAPKFAFDLHKSGSHLTVTFASCQQGNLLEVWQGKIWISSASESSWCLSTAVCHSWIALISLRNVKIQWTLDRDSHESTYDIFLNIAFKFWRKIPTQQFLTRE